MSCNFNTVKSQEYHSQDHTPLPLGSWRMQSSKKSVIIIVWTERLIIQEAQNLSALCPARELKTGSFPQSGSENLVGSHVFGTRRNNRFTFCWWLEWCYVDRHRDRHNHGDPGLCRPCRGPGLELTSQAKRRSIKPFPFSETYNGLPLLLSKSNGPFNGF